MKLLLPVLTAVTAQINVNVFVKNLWFNWTQEFNYVPQSSEEESHAFQNFAKNYEFVQQHNARFENGEETFAVKLNQFAHLSIEEFAERYLMPKHDFTPKKIAQKLVTRTAKEYPCPILFQAESQSYPEVVSYRPTNLTENPSGIIQVTKVKNQGQCGSCWSFGSAAAMEAEMCRKGRKMCQYWDGLASQQIVDCSSFTQQQSCNPDVINLRPYDDHGCHGGFQSNAMRYAMLNNGLMDWMDYPYTSGYTMHMQKCNSDPALEYKDIIDDCGGTVFGNETELAQAVAEVGAMTISIDAGTTSFQLYDYGVYSNPNCSSVILDHAVTVTGYGVWADEGPDFWEVKNSWGTDWGMDGYVYMIRNDDNNCGVASDARYAISEKSDMYNFDMGSG